MGRYDSTAERPERQANESLWEPYEYGVVGWLLVVKFWVARQGKAR